MKIEVTEQEYNRIYNALFEARTIGTVMYDNIHFIIDIDKNKKFVEIDFIK